MTAKLWYIISFVTFFCCVGLCIFVLVCDFPYGIKAIGICALVIWYIAEVMSFYTITHKYTKNSLKGDSYDFKRIKLAHSENDENKFIINVTVGEIRGTWTISSGDVYLEFDLSGYMFPKWYICTYFIRNIHFITLNSRHLKFSKLFKSLDLGENNKYKEVSLIFCYGKKQKKFDIVKEGKSRVNLIMKWIMEAPYSHLCLSRSSSKYSIYKKCDGRMNDKKFREGEVSVYGAE